MVGKGFWPLADGELALLRRVIDLAYVAIQPVDEKGAQHFAFDQCTAGLDRAAGAPASIDTAEPLKRKVAHVGEKTVISGGDRVGYRDGTHCLPGLIDFVHRQLELQGGAQVY